MIIRLILAIIILIIPVSQSAADVVIGVVTVSTSQQNLNPAIAYNPDADNFLIVWSHSSDIMDYSDAEISAVLLETQPVIDVVHATAISRPTNLKFHSPMIAVAYSPYYKRWIVAWQEAQELDRTMLLTTLDSTGAFVRRASKLVGNQGILLSRPLLVNSAGGNEMTIIWNEVKNGSLRSCSLQFDPDAPHDRNNVGLVIDFSSHLVELARAIVSNQEGTYRIYGFLTNITQGVNRMIYDRAFSNMSGPADSRDSVTKRKLKPSITLSVSKGEYGNLVLYNQHNVRKERFTLSLFLHETDVDRLLRPSASTPRVVESFEGLVTEPATDGFHRMVWVEEFNDQYRLLVQPVTPDAERSGSAVVVQSSKKPITHIAAAYGKNGSELVVVWCEDAIDEAVVRVKAAVVDLATELE